MMVVVIHLHLQYSFQLQDHPNGTNASAVAITTEIGGVFSVKEIVLTNAGAGYTVAPDIKYCRWWR